MMAWESGFVLHKHLHEKDSPVLILSSELVVFGSYTKQSVTTYMDKGGSLLQSSDNLPYFIFLIASFGSLWPRESYLEAAFLDSMVNF